MAEGTAKRTAERIAALRFILNPPDILFFLQAYARAMPSGRLDPEPGGLTGMRSSGGAPAISGYGVGPDKAREAADTHPSGSLRSSRRLWITNR
jgi:hypothetical protein